MNVEAVKRPIEGVNVEGVKREASQLVTLLLVLRFLTIWSEPSFFEPSRWSEP